VVGGLLDVTKGVVEGGGVTPISIFYKIMIWDNLDQELVKIQIELQTKADWWHLGSNTFRLPTV
jgi:hypothetical protein